MKRSTTALVLFVIVFHGAAFVVESLLWMRPAIHTRVLSRLTDSVVLDVHDRALVLKTLFVNQGFYNLFLAIAGIAGLAFLRRGSTAVGQTLIGYMCLSAVGAGVVLAVSTGAYVGAFLQAVPAALALAGMFRDRSADRRR